MNYGDNYFQTLLKQATKQGLLEFLSENNLSIISTRTSSGESMISTNEAIKLLGGINRQTLYKYIDQGLPAYRNGKSYKFRINDLNEFINKNNRKK